MLPTDETPESGPCPGAHTFNHNHGKAQEAPPGAPAPPPPKGPVHLPDGEEPRNTPELVRLYCRYLSQPTEDRRDELLKECLKFLKNRISYWVYVRGFCPPWSHPDVFSEDVFDRASSKFWSRLHVLRSPKKFERWMKKVAFSSVVDEPRKKTGRAKSGPRHWGPLEIKGPDGSVTHVLEHAENYHAAVRSRLHAC